MNLCLVLTGTFVIFCQKTLKTKSYPCLLNYLQLQSKIVAISRSHQAVDWKLQCLFGFLRVFSSIWKQLCVCFVSDESKMCQSGSKTLPAETSAENPSVPAAAHRYTHPDTHPLPVLVCSTNICVLKMIESWCSFIDSMWIKLGLKSGLSALASFWFWYYTST